MYAKFASCSAVCYIGGWYPHLRCIATVGQLFPDTDPKWRGASSDIFVKEAVSGCGSVRKNQYPTIVYNERGPLWLLQLLVTVHWIVRLVGTACVRLQTQGACSMWCCAVTMVSPWLCHCNTTSAIKGAVISVHTAA